MNNEVLNITKASLIALLVMFNSLIISANTFNNDNNRIDSNSSDIFEEDTPHNPENILYGDLGYLYISSNFTVNYERIFSNVFVLRIGFGKGVGADLKNTKIITTGSVALFMMEMLLFKGTHGIELGAGLTFCSAETFEYFDSYYAFNYTNYSIISDLNIAVTVGYRHQPQPEGPFFRCGFSIIGFTYGVHFSLGYAF